MHSPSIAISPAITFHIRADCTYVKLQRRMGKRLVVRLQNLLS